MVFSSLFFLWVFLPVVLITYYLLPRPFRNLWLLLASLGFYAFGEGWYTLVMGATILFNWLAALRRWPIVPVVFANLAALIGFKYLAFFAGIFQILAPSVHLPIGISFFIFQAMSYSIDVHRGQVPPNKSPWEFGTYLALFPQLIAGPIVRYAHVARQLSERQESLSLFASGVERFIIGLAKKVLLADTLARGADYAFGLEKGELHAPTAWLGIICYSLQIFYDFSGYSDMAIGLGRMFGFRFLENFNAPYSARSIQDFWRRWHISLSTWFRDYLYIPLGGNRNGKWRKIGNQFLVFALCGLWHGPSWNFLAWGLWHGAFLSLESFWLGTWLTRRNSLFSHTYTLLALLGGWVLFRAETLSASGAYYYAMGDFNVWPSKLPGADPELLFAIAVGTIWALGWPKKLTEKFLLHIQHRTPLLLHGLRALLLVLTLIASLIWLAGANSNTFIYFRF